MIHSGKHTKADGDGVMVDRWAIEMTTGHTKY